MITEKESAKQGSDIFLTVPEKEIETERKVIDDSFQRKGEFQSKRIQNENVSLIDESGRIAEMMILKKELEDRYQRLKTRGQEEELSRKKKIEELLATLQDLKIKTQETKKSNEKSQAEHNTRLKMTMYEYFQKRDAMKAELLNNRDAAILQIQNEKEKIQTQIDTFRQEFDMSSENLLAKKKREKEDLIAAIARLDNTVILDMEDSPDLEDNFPLDDYCSVCLSSQASICLLPCAHLALCRYCNQNLKSVGYFCCSLCQSHVEKRYLVTRKDLRESTDF